MTHRDESLEHKLETYRATAAARRAAPDEVAPRAAQWLGYGAASAALVMGSGAEAAIMYSGVQNIVVGQGGATVLDLDGNAAGDFAFSLHVSTSAFTTTTTTTTPGGATTTTTVDASYRSVGLDMFGLAGGNIFLTGPAGSVVRYAASDQLTPALSGTDVAFLTHHTTYAFDGVASTSAFSSTFGTGTGFLGVQFDRGGDSHLGWIRVNVSRAPAPAGGEEMDQFTIIDWAWESEANRGIHVGSTASASVPAPATTGLLGLGLLAAGAAGIRRMRRRRAEGEVSRD